MTITTNNGVIKVVSTVAEYDKIIKTIGFVGYLGNMFEVYNDIAQYKNGQISEARLVYRVTGVGASIGADILTGMIM